MDLWKSQWKLWIHGGRFLESSKLRSLLNTFFYVVVKVVVYVIFDVFNLSIVVNNNQIINNNCRLQLDHAWWRLNPYFRPNNLIWWHLDLVTTWPGDHLTCILPKMLSYKFQTSSIKIEDFKINPIKPFNPITKNVL